MKDIAIYGAGGLGREMALLIQQINEVKLQWNLVGFYDDNKKGELVDQLPVLGGIQEVNAVKDNLLLVIAIADCETRYNIVSKITNKNIDYPTLKHPKSLTGSDKNKFGIGSIITAGCILTTGIDVGDFVILNLACTVGHDVSIKNFTSIMPGCNISGNVIIGERTLVGTGARILQGLTIGNQCKIGAGAVVTKNITSGKTAIGIPAKER